MSEPVCISCKKPFTKENVYSPDGWREIKISQMCELCFDACTMEPEVDEYGGRDE